MGKSELPGIKRNKNPSAKLGYKGYNFEDAKLYLRVSTEYYKRVMIKNAHNEYEEILKLWNITEIKRDYNNDKHFIESIPRYDLFCNIPDNTVNYKRVIDTSFNSIHSVLYNRYHPIIHKPKQGKFPFIKQFLSHIFHSKNLSGEPLIEFGLDYLQILYTQPTQRLPVLCLVSKERRTGKSTFLDFLRAIFGGNVAILDNERFTSKFTSHFIDKLIIGIDESFIPMEQKLMKERIKNMSTGRRQWLEQKSKDAQEIEYYGKLILCSNDEHNFMQIDEGEDRFAVIKVPVLKEDDPVLLDKMKLEIPALLFFLNQRKLKYDHRQGRFSFRSDIYLTQAQKNVESVTKSRIEKELTEFLQDSFVRFRKETLEFSAIDLVEELNKNTAYRFDKTKIIEFLKFDKDMSPSSAVKRYTLYEIWEEAEPISDTPGNPAIKAKKTGRPYIFYYKDWSNLTEKDMKSG